MATRAEVVLSDQDREVLERWARRPMSLELPRFRGHLMAVPTGRPERMSVDAKDTAVFEGVPG
jgi:hypothetical protein